MFKRTLIISALLADPSLVCGQGIVDTITCKYSCKGYIAKSTNNFTFRSTKGTTPRVGEFVTLRSQDRDAVMLVKVFAMQWYTNNHLKLRPRFKVTVVKGKRITLNPASANDSIALNKVMTKFDLTLEKMFLDFSRLESIKEDNKFWPGSNNIRTQGQLIADRKYGRREEFSENGVLIKVEHYDVTGRKDSLWIDYDEEGNRISEMKYRDYKLISYNEWYADGSIKLKSNEANATEYYNDGTLLSSGKLNLVYVPGSKDGLWTSFYKNGTIKSKIEFRHGKIAGQHLEWFMNGQKKIISFKYYSSGGKHLEWYNNGQLKTEAYFTRREYKDSLYREFNRDGTLLVEQEYDDGLLNGNSCWYHANGNVRKREHYTSSKRDSFATWYANDELASTYNFQREKWFEYFESGSIKKEYNSPFNNTLKKGSYQEWYESGALMCYGVFTKSDSTGNWMFYHENSERKSKVRYSRNKKKGQYVSWHANGQQYAFGEFDSAGGHTGLWTAFYEDGTRKYRGEYLYDKKVEKWLYWDINGKKRKEKY